MAPSKLRQAVGAAKDQTTIALVRASAADEVASDVEACVVRATAHGEASPAEERHAEEILTLTRYSRARVAACVAAVSRRLGRARAWPVAVKALALLHRLLAEGDPAFEHEVFLATRRGRRVLDVPPGFLDRARSRHWDFAAFVRAYAAYLDDRLKHRMQARGGGAGAAASTGKWHAGDGDGDDTTFEMADAEAWELVPGAKKTTTTTTEDVIAKAQQLKHLLGRFIECRPTGKARTNPVVTAALHRLVKESAAMYCELTEVMVVLVDRFAELGTPACVRVHAIFTSLAKLVDELHDFYSWCKATDVCRPSDVPEVQRVRQRNLDLMDEFIRDRQAAAASTSAQWGRSPATPTPVTKNDDVVRGIEPAPKQQQGVALEESNSGMAAPAEPAATSLAVVVDDETTADFLNLGEDASLSACGGEEHGRNLTLALFEGNSSVETEPKWVAFDDSEDDGETALVHSTSTAGAERSELGGGFNTTVLDYMYSRHATVNATVTNTRAFAGSASSVATQPLGATVLALPPPSVASTNTAAASARSDPFAASMAVPPPMYEYVQMTDLETRQRLHVQEQNSWQQYEMRRAAWNYNLL